MPNQKKEYEKYINSEEVTEVLRGKRNLLSALTVMRKICNHPDLLTLGTKDIPDDYGDASRSGKLNVIEKILPSWLSENNRVLMFSQTQKMLDIIEEFCIKKVCYFLLII